MPNSSLSCLALGASTGGLYALGEFLKALPGPIGAPILITQHLPDVFMPFFARQIAAASGRRAQVAVEGIPLQAEQIFIAPGDAHLCLARGGRGVCVSLSRATARSGCLPSVDHMLWSVSEIYGRNWHGIVVRGRGRERRKK